MTNGMTAGELRDVLATLPDDAVVGFALWQADSKYHGFVMKRSHSPKQMTGKDCGGDTVLIVAHADNCQMDSVVID